MREHDKNKIVDGMSTGFIIATLSTKRGIRIMTTETPEEELWDRAYAAGIAAAEATNPVPMVVAQHANPLDDASPVTRQYFVPQGACGFAWIIIRPGNSKFANWIKKNNLGRPDSYYGGVNIWIGEHSQSHQKKYAHACAMAKVFSDAGIKAIPYERLD